MSSDPQPTDERNADESRPGNQTGSEPRGDEPRRDLPSDPEAPGTYVDDDGAGDVAEPNEPG